MAATHHIFSGKRVLLTGHTGFKGGWLALWLRELGAGVWGYALPAHEPPGLFEILPRDRFERSWERDIREPGGLREAVRESRPDLVFHLAAQPIVGAGYRDPVGTFTTNALGTALLLEAVRQEGCPAAVVVVTSDKCYRNDDTGRAFIESDPLGGADVYSMSKAAAELVAASWHASFFSKEEGLGPVATGRAGNVIGGGDYAEDRIVPDAVRAHLAKGGLTLRNPAATRPWQHVLESVSGYLALGARLLHERDSGRLLNFNFGPEPEAVRSVQDLVDAWLEAWPDAFRFEKFPVPPYPEAARLSLDPSAAKRELGWRPVWDFRQTVVKTAEWYRARHEQGFGNDEMLELTIAQIADYTRDARSAGVSWVQ
jgi:CDP-glucose 4,6-dehydratase